MPYKTLWYILTIVLAIFLITFGNLNYRNKVSVKSIQQHTRLQVSQQQILGVQGGQTDFSLIDLFQGHVITSSISSINIRKLMVSWSLYSQVFYLQTQVYELIKSSLQGSRLFNARFPSKILNLDKNVGAFNPAFQDQSIFHKSSRCSDRSCIIFI